MQVLLVYSSCTVSICHFYFQVLTYFPLLNVQQKKNLHVVSLSYVEVFSLLLPALVFLSNFLQRFVFSFSILIAGIRGVWIPHRFPQAALLDHSGDRLRTKCFSAKTGLKRLKWDCVSSACLLCFSF